MTFKLPHPFVLLLSAVVVAVAMTWVIPVGKYERRADAATGRDVVIPGSYTRIAQAPLGTSTVIDVRAVYERAWASWRSLK